MGHVKEILTADDKSMPESDDTLQQAIADYLQAEALGQPLLAMPRR